MSDTHKVYRFTSSSSDAYKLTQKHEAIPTPRPFEVLVRIRAVALNYTDILICGGTYAGEMPVKTDVVPGSDMAGEVVKIGESVSGFKIGDRVISAFHQRHLYGPHMDWDHCLGGSIDGTLQEYRVFEHSVLLHIPAHLSYNEAACFPMAGTTAWNALYGGMPLIAGQTVLLQGTGGVSMMGLIFAHAAGAKTIITSSSDDKLALAKKLGATHTINYKTTPNWDEKVLELTNGIGAHHILDTVGIAEANKIINATARGGEVACIGWFGNLKEGEAIPNVPGLLLKKNVSMRGVLIGSRLLLEDLLRLVEAKELRPVIDRVFSFDQTVDGLEFLASGKHFGKVVVDMQK